MNTRENFAILADDCFGFRAKLDIFAELREKCGDSAIGETAGGGKGVV